MTQDPEIVKIRPDPFVGMRIYGYDHSSQWWTVTKIDNKLTTMKPDEGYSEAFYTGFLKYSGPGIYYLLPGEPGCPPDPKARTFGEWQVDDEFWRFDKGCEIWQKGIVQKACMTMYNLAAICSGISYKADKCSYFCSERSKDYLNWLYIPKEKKNISADDVIAIWQTAFEKYQIPEIKNGSRVTLDSIYLDKVNNSHKCPICNSPGDDLIFNFYCSNNNCQNYKK